MSFDKDIPIPPSPMTKAAKLSTMEIGDSLLVASDEANNWRYAMRVAAAGGDFYFVSRAVEGGVRIWRRA